MGPELKFSVNVSRYYNFALKSEADSDFMTSWKII
jgi:hypothetical protein